MDQPPKIPDYEIISPLGSGTMGHVWLAKDRFGERRAIKVTHIDYATVTEYQRRFRREVRAQQQLYAVSSHVARIFDYDETHFPPYIVMDYIDGMDLNRMIAMGEMDTVDLQTRLHWIEALASTLTKAHSIKIKGDAHGIIHRDIKPQNIRIQGQRPYLLDFSISLTSDVEIDSTQDAMTLRYVAPEITASEASDIFSFALVAFEILFEIHPITTYEEASKIMMSQYINFVEAKLRNSAWRLPSTIDVKFPALDMRRNRKRLDMIFLKALSIEPSRRYKTPKQFSDSLLDVLVGPPTSRDYHMFTSKTTTETPHVTLRFDDTDFDLEFEIEDDEPSTESESPSDTRQFSQSEAESEFPSDTRQFSQSEIESWSSNEDSSSNSDTPAVVNETSSSDDDADTPQVVTEASPSDNDADTPQAVTEASPSDNDADTPQVVTEASSRDSDADTPQVVTEASPSDNDPDVVNETSSRDSDPDTPQVVNKASSSNDDTDTPQVVNKASSSNDDTDTPQAVTEASPRDNDPDTPQVVNEASSSDNGADTSKGTNIRDVSISQTPKETLTFPKQEPEFWSSGDILTDTIIQESHDSGGSQNKPISKTRKVSVQAQHTTSLIKEPNQQTRRITLTVLSAIIVSVLVIGLSVSGNQGTTIADNIAPDTEGQIIAAVSTSIVSAQTITASATPTNTITMTTTQDLTDTVSITSRATHTPEVMDTASPAPRASRTARSISGATPTIVTTPIQTLTSNSNATIEPWQIQQQSLILSNVNTLIDSVYIPKSCANFGGSDTICVEQSAWIDLALITNKTYDLCVRNAVCSRPAFGERYDPAGAGANNPVVGVNLRMVEVYCNWRDARLPTSAEWYLFATHMPDAVTELVEWTKNADSPAGQSYIYTLTNDEIRGFWSEDLYLSEDLSFRCVQSE